MMPTGYTARLEERGYDVKRWLKEDAVRAMGVCVMLRDEGNLSQAEIRQGLNAVPASYAEEKLEKSKLRLAELRSRTDAKWREAHEACRSEEDADYQRRLKEHNTKKEKHLAAMNEVRAMLSAAKGLDSESVTVGTLKFALEQLERAFEFDYGHEPWKGAALTTTPDLWREMETEEAEKQVGFYETDVKRQKARTVDRSASYDEFCRFVDSVKAGNDNVPTK